MCGAVSRRRRSRLNWRGRGCKQAVRQAQLIEDALGGLALVSMQSPDLRDEVPGCGWKEPLSTCRKGRVSLHCRETPIAKIIFPGKHRKYLVPNAEKGLEWERGAGEKCV